MAIKFLISLILLSNAPLMDEAEVLEIAEKALLEKGVNIEKLEPPVSDNAVIDEYSKTDGSWKVHYFPKDDLQLGGGVSVYIDDKTKEAEIIFGR